jgi:hypothetical protein
MAVDRQPACFGGSRTRHGPAFSVGGGRGWTSAADGSYHSMVDTSVRSRGGTFLISRASSCYPSHHGPRLARPGTTITLRHRGLRARSSTCAPGPGLGLRPPQRSIGLSQILSEYLAVAFDPRPGPWSKVRRMGSEAAQWRSQF